MADKNNDIDILNQQISSFLGDEKELNAQPAVAPAPKSDDDEFEKLLQEFIASELNNVDHEAETEDLKEAVAQNKPHPATIATQDEFSANLYEEEKALYTAYNNFRVSITAMAEEFKLPVPEFGIEPQMLYPRYKPALAEKFALDTLKGWDIMIKAHPSRILNIKPNAKDEDLLDFAEKTTDPTLQLAVISYVEVLIEIEGCEIAYESRRLKAKKRKIEKEIYEEHYKRKERIKKYIEALQKKKFPVDAERLVNNYFKTAKKDADGAYKTLVNNPATFAPIDVSKIPARFFGMIKPKPEDGIRVNREIGEFLKKLKV